METSPLIFMFFILGDGNMLWERHWLHASPCGSCWSSVIGWKAVSGPHGNNWGLSSCQHK